MPSGLGSAAMGKTAIYGICRVDNEASRTHGWVVTIQRRGVIYRRQFSDGKLGGKRKALATAKRYRDDLVSRFPPLRRGDHADIVKRNNTSGVVGVSRYCATESRDRPSPKQRWYWVASWSLPDGSPRRVKFSIGKYGEAEAFRLAARARRAAIKKMEGDFDPGAARLRLGKSRLG